MIPTTVDDNEFEFMIINSGGNRGKLLKIVDTTLYSSLGALPILAALALSSCSPPRQRVGR